MMETYFYLAILIVSALALLYGLSNWIVTSTIISSKVECDFKEWFKEGDRKSIFDELGHLYIVDYMVIPFIGVVFKCDQPYYGAPKRYVRTFQVYGKPGVGWVEVNPDRYRMKNINKKNK